MGSTDPKKKRGTHIEAKKTPDGEKICEAENDKGGACEKKAQQDHPDRC